MASTAHHSAGGALDGKFLGVTAEMATQGDDAILRGDIDRGRVGAGIEGQLAEHTLLQPKVMVQLHSWLRRSMT